MTGLCMAIPTSRKGATRHQLTQLKKFVMENGFGHSTIQVDNEPAIIQVTEVAARELGLPWRHSTTHTHQGQGAVERLHQTIFAQVRSIKFDLVDRYNLKTVDDIPETLFPWVLQHACFTINKYLVHADGMTNYQHRWGVKHNSAICQFGEVV
eukprot:3669245-Amphidinium_carterae.1